MGSDWSYLTPASCALNSRGGAQGGRGGARGGLNDELVPEGWTYIQLSTKISTKISAQAEGRHPHPREVKEDLSTRY